MKNIIIFLIILSLIPYSSFGLSNITIQSSNEKNITITTLESNQKSYVDSNTTKEIEYDNYILNIKTNSSKFNIDEIVIIGKKINSDAMFLIFAIFIIALLITAINLLKRM